MNKIVLANWKANLSPERALAWCDAFAAVAHPRGGVETVLAVPALILESVYERTRKIPGVSLAAQGVSPYPQGSYTGALPAAWMRGVVRYGLIGHRERREYFHETVQDVARQGYELLAEEIVPIVCVDSEVLVRQAAAFALEELDRLIWAWTPTTSVGLEMARDTAAIATGVAEVARKTDKRPVLYGGGVTPDNGQAIWSLPGVAGIMLGQGCLDAAAFAELVNRL